MVTAGSDRERDGWEIGRLVEADTVGASGGLAEGTAGAAATTSKELI